MFFAGFDLLFSILFPIPVSYTHLDGHFAPAAGKRTDRSSGFVTIHDGHLDLHKNEIVPLFWRFHRLFDCNFSVFGAVDGHACHAYDLGCDLTVQLVILHKKDPLTRIVFLRKVFQIVPGRCV